MESHVVRKTACFITLTVAFTGCSVTYKSPGLGSLPANQIAILLNPTENVRHWPWIDSVDGKSTGQNNTVRVELTPGKHTLVMKPNNAAVERKFRPICFNAIAGAVYHTDSLLNLEHYPYRWTLYIRENSTNEIVSYEGPTCRE